MRCKCGKNDILAGCKTCYDCRSKSKNYCQIKNCFLPQADYASCIHHEAKWLKCAKSGKEAYIKWMSEQ